MRNRNGETQLHLFAIYLCGIEGDMMTLEERKRCSIGILLVISANPESQDNLYRAEVLEVFKKLSKTIEKTASIREKNMYHPYPITYIMSNENYSFYQITEFVFQIEAPGCEEKIEMIKSDLKNKLNILKVLKIIDQYEFAKVMEYFEGTLRGIYNPHRQ